MPRRLKRGQQWVTPDGWVVGARLKRNSENLRKINAWHWGKEPLLWTEELIRLRVMMAMINNLDLKDSNNGIYRNVHGSSLQGQDAW